MLKWGVPEGWYPSLDRIGGVDCPILIMHGERDTLVPFEMARRLFAAAPAASADGVARRLVRLPLADHNDVVEAEGMVMLDALREFLCERGARGLERDS
ncbi:MAG: alpha/beta hydrolase [Planctomycetaceae bacterium]|nr:MAG: alpha/beta hydrolase [Planctomycetaceae bacterium]